MCIGGGLPVTVYDGYCLLATSFGRNLIARGILSKGFSRSPMSVFDIFCRGMKACYRPIRSHQSKNYRHQNARCFCPYYVTCGSVERGLGVNKGRIHCTGSGGCCVVFKCAPFTSMPRGSKLAAFYAIRVLTQLGPQTLLIRRTEMIDFVGWSFSL